MTHASLFSGIGGAELAASWMGWQNLFHCEIQEFPRKVLEYWYPNSISYDDIKKTDFREWKGRVNVLTAGFPCQPFSVAGKRAGADDDRYLWPETIRAIREIQPAWFVGENVAGIISMVQPGEEAKMGCTDDLFEQNYIYRKEQEYTLPVICKDLERAGFAVQPFVIPACAVGAPHRRDRVWIVANRSDARAKDLQREWQDEISKSSFASHTDSNRQRQRQNEQKPVSKLFGKTDTCSCSTEEITTNAKCDRRCEIHQTIQSQQSNGYQSYRIGDKWYVGNKNRPQDRWRNFPSESPLCSRHDGLPFNVDDLTISFPKWRQEAIKALGNAWVPQVAYEIFKAIEQFERTENAKQ